MLNRLKLILNPFDNVYYASAIKPHSRTLHTSFWEKMRDTFQVFDGGFSIYTIRIKKKITKKFKFIPLNLNDRPGLFDYLTLGVFRDIHALDTLFTSIMHAETENMRGVKKAGVILGKILASPFYAAFTIANIVANGIVRHAVSGLLTLAFSPIVFASHLISKAVLAYKANKLAEDMPLENSDVGINNVYQLLGKASLKDAVISDAKKEFKPRAIVEDCENLQKASCKISSEKTFTTYEFNLLKSGGKDKDRFERLVEVNQSARIAFDGDEESKIYVNRR